MYFDTPCEVRNNPEGEGLQLIAQSSVTLGDEIRVPAAEMGFFLADSYCFSPNSVQFKGEINDALPRKRHQKRHLEFCTA